MVDGTHPLVEQTIQICLELGVDQFIIAPGSRSAPLTAALAQHPSIHCRVVTDERAAAHVALGLAQQLQRPVGVVCTSGTAAVNFGPAVVEAFYQQIPLLVMTADRPPEWIDQQDNQAIHQTALYAPHVRASYTLPLDDGAAATRWYAGRIVAEAIQTAGGVPPGPVHINIPLREPLYAPPDQPPAFAQPVRVARRAHTVPQLSDDAWREILLHWHSARRKLIVAGMHTVDAGLTTSLATLATDNSVAVIGDITSNLFPAASSLLHWDMVLGSRDAATTAALAPDLVVSFGGQVTSKYVKTLLRSNAPAQLWHVAPTTPAPDTYQGLTLAIPMRAVDFFQRLALEQRSADAQPAQAQGAAYAEVWQRLNAGAAETLDRFMAEAPFGEFRAMWQVMRALPAASRLQLGNSMPIRYANFIGPAPGHTPGTINSNRGASGIDGTVSTAVGAALADETLTTLIVGDLAFFYDRNGLWHGHVPANLRIVLLNNHGGGIFDIIDGPQRLPRDIQTTYFLTPQPLTAERTAADHGLDYERVTTEAGLAAALPAFFAPRPRAAILEIESEMAVNTAVFQEFKSRMA